MISNDGKWVVYTINVQEGDNELVIQVALMQNIKRPYQEVIVL
jgi:hypothetical protein